MPAARPPVSDLPLPEVRPLGVGRLTWALARLASLSGPRYGVLLVAMAAGLVGSAALVAHALNAPSLQAYERSRICGAGPLSPDCRALVPGIVVADVRLPLRIQAITLFVGRRTVVYYGVSEAGGSGTLPPGSQALVLSWQGRAARIYGRGLILEPFDGPPGASFGLLLLAVACELVCTVGLGLHGAAARLRASALPVRGAGFRGPPYRVLFLLALAVAVLASFAGHWTVAVPLHLAAGAVAVSLLTLAGGSAALTLASVARDGMDALSEEPAMRLGADTALAAVLVALCLSLTLDLVVADLLTLPP